MKRTSFGVLVIKGPVRLHGTILLQLLQHYWVGHRFGFCDPERFVLGMNRGHSVVFEIASKYRISDSFFDCDGSSISSKRFLPTVLDIMVI